MAQPSPPRAPTAAQIAAVAGVSRPTVSRILNGDDARYSEATRSRVLEAAASLGYRPNALARAMRTGRTGIVGLILGTEETRSHIAGRMLTALHDALAAHKLRLMICTLPDASLESPDLVPHLLEEVCVDGLVINYTHRVPAALPVHLAQANLPTVWLNVADQTPNVCPDDHLAGKLATQQLIDRGHQNIGWVCSIGPVHYSVGGRRDGYLEAMRAAGLKPSLWEASSGTLTNKQRRSWITDVAKAGLSAAVCYGDIDTYALHIATERRGLDVPRDLSLVSFGDEPPKASGVTVSTMVTPLEDMAQRAVDHLLARMADEHTAAITERVAFTWVSGESVVDRR
ncbi:MAG: LacI family DNA-binding transcriptional regulator [Planctomycetota bacterium]|nr:LacI family DNA-binding transcriptional regulator [Planctomycetota bacterium]